jgi:hypothetical protein
VGDRMRLKVFLILVLFINLCSGMEKISQFCPPCLQDIVLKFLIARNGSDTMRLGVLTETAADLIKAKLFKDYQVLFIDILSNIEPVQIRLPRGTGNFFALLQNQYLLYGSPEVTIIDMRDPKKILLKCTNTFFNTVLAGISYDQKYILFKMRNNKGTDGADTRECRTKVSILDLETLNFTESPTELLEWAEGSSCIFNGQNFSACIYSPDERKVVLGDFKEIVSGSDNHGNTGADPYVFELSPSGIPSLPGISMSHMSRELLSKYPFTEAPQFSPDARFSLICCDFCEIVLYLLETMVPIRLLAPDTNSRLLECGFSPDSRYAYVCLENKDRTKIFHHFDLNNFPQYVHRKLEMKHEADFEPEHVTFSDRGLIVQTIDLKEDAQFRWGMGKKSSGYKAVHIGDPREQKSAILGLPEHTKLQGNVQAFLIDGTLVCSCKDETGPFLYIYYFNDFINSLTLQQQLFVVYLATINDMKSFLENKENQQTVRDMLLSVENLEIRNAIFTYFKMDEVKAHKAQ